MTAPNSWGPFLPGLEPSERKARLRCLRLAVRLLTGPRGSNAAYLLLLAEIDPHPAMLADASAEFDRLAPIDRRRVLSSFAGSLPTRIAS